MYINSQTAFEDLCAKLETGDLIAIDTEFLREKTYHAKLCLIQLGNDDICALVDPFAIKNYSPLARLFENKNIVKVFHAATQDVEILLRACGTCPKPLFDTQVAASLLGHPQQIGLGPLVKATCGITLPKADSYTDWSRRPLLDTQIKYAADDIRYLPRIYRQMKEQLSKTGRAAWLDDEFERLSSPETYAIHPEEMWHRVKRVTTLRPSQLGIAREVAAWREVRAQEKDLPRKWVLTDEALIEIARRAPKTRQELCQVRGLSGHLSRHEMEGILHAVREAENMPPAQWPQAPQKIIDSHSVAVAVDLMTALVRARAEENDVAAPVLASHDDLSHLAHGEKDIPLMQGWRYKIVGRELEELLAGSITLSLNNCELVVVKNDVQ